MSPALSGVLALVAVLLALDPRPRTRPGATRRRGPRLPRPGSTTAAVLLGVGALLYLGGTAGVVVGVVLGLAVRLLVPRLESASARRRRDRLAVQAPLTIDLVTACLAAGAGVDASLTAAARAVGAPMSEVLRRATTALALGADPVAVWREVAATEGLASFGRALARSTDTGAALGALLPRVAEEARAAHRARVETRVRTAAVRLTAPLGAAFLPAVVLLGVVPVVASWVGVLL